MSKTQRKMDQINHYMQEKLDPLIKRIYKSTKLHQPDDIYDYIIDFLEKEKQNQQIEIEQYSDIFSSENEDEFFQEDFKPQMIKKNKNSVCMNFNQIDIVLQKQQENKSNIDKLKIYLKQNSIFKQLEQQTIDNLVQYLQQCEFNDGETVIKENDIGDCLYLVFKGELDCYKIINNENKQITTYQEGDIFGELALLYLKPRQATIVAKSHCILYKLSAQVFKVINTVFNQRLEFFKNVSIFEGFDQQQMNNLMDFIEPISLKKDEYIIRQGATDKFLYFLEKGTADCFIEFEGEQKYQKSYKRYDYFGEMALLTNNNRMANIIASSDVDLLRLGKSAFNNIIGSLRDILQKNAQSYLKY